jgi:hypothetical protein
MYFAGGRMNPSVNGSLIQTRRVGIALTWDEIMLAEELDD